MKIPPILPALLVTAALLARPTVVQAQTWTGATDAQWATSTNWSGGIVPGATTGTTNADTALFNSNQANGTSVPIEIDPNRNILGFTFDTSAGNFTVGSAAGNALILTSGGAISVASTLAGTGKTQAVNAPLVLEAAGPSSTGSYSFTNNNTTSTNLLNFGGSISGGATTETVTLTLNGANNGFNTISSVISNGLAGNVAITKSGSGTWALGGANSYSGATTVSTGTLRITHGSALGSNAAGTTVASGATLQLAGNITVASETLAIAGNGANSNGALRNSSGNNTWAGTININTGVVTRIISNSGTLTLSGNLITSGNAANGLVLQGDGNGIVTGVISGDAHLTKSVTGNGTWTLSGNNTFTGSTTISNGTISINSLGNLGASSALGAPTTVANGTIKIGNLNVGATLRYTGGATSTDRVIDLAGTTGTATLDASGTGAIAFTSNFTATGSGSKTLTLTGSNTANNTIAGAIVNNSGTNVTSVTKNGAGKWILSGANTYTGATTVNAGTLLINGSLAAGSAVAVNSGGTLGGSGGSVNGTVSIAGGGTIAPGASIGTLNTGALTIASGGTFALEIDTTAGTADLLNVAGGINLDAGNNSILTLTDLGANAALTLGSTLMVADYSGAWNGGLFNFGGTTLTDDSQFTLGANTFQFSYNGVDGLTSAFTLQVVPEPSACLMLLAGIGFVATARRKTHRPLC